MRRTILALSFMLAACGLSLIAQAPSPGAAQEVRADLNQLMRGVLYPAANVVFFPQAENPADVKPIPGNDPSMATDPLTSTFGGWQAVENAALALAESANLLLIPGRMCANGTPAPMKDPAWATFVQQLRDAGMQAYTAALAKDQEKMITIAETLSASCNGCHRKWRDRRTPANRCK
ncbi:MAG: hypothetical protein ABI868_04065 [Acidobacteriota bacterium]